MDSLKNMKDTPFASCFNSSALIMTEGAIVERLKSEFHLKMDEDIVHAGLIYNNEHAKILAGIYRQYIDIALKNDLPIMITTPTRRASQERISRSLYSSKNVIYDCVEFLSAIRKSYGPKGEKIFIGGLMGCRGDAYNAKEALPAERAYIYHKRQAEQFKNAGVDFLFAGIMPEISEAIGMAKAMEETWLPYIISFMIRKNGRMMDGTTINRAIELIDEAAKLRPLCYMVNCVHPKILNEALSLTDNQTELVRRRFAGIQANASSLSPEKLDGCGELKSDDPVQLTDAIQEIYKYGHIKIFGGCCGTDNRHMDELARRMRNWLAE